MSDHPIVFDLTPLTRGAAAQRRIVIKTFEMRSQVFVILVGTFALSLPVALILWPLVHSYGLIAFPTFAVAGLWLFDWRSSKGMRQSNWSRLKLRSLSQSGSFYVAGRRIDPTANPVRILITGTVLAPRIRVDPTDPSVQSVTLEEGWA